MRGCAQAEHKHRKFIFNPQNPILMLFQALCPRLSGGSVCPLTAVLAARAALLTSGCFRSGLRQDFTGKCPNSGSQPAPSRAGDTCSKGDEFNLSELPSEQVLREGGGRNCAPSSAGMSQLKVREKAAARTQLPMAPKITVCPSALPRNRI